MARAARYLVPETALSIKPSACEARLLKHTGRALFFDDYPSFRRPVDDPKLDVTGDDILVLR